VITALRLRDFNLVMQMVLSGRMKAELEEETLITWLTQVPPKPPRIPEHRDNVVEWYNPEQAAAQMRRLAGMPILEDSPLGYKVKRDEE
jgi:hypothetical protein